LIHDAILIIDLDYFAIEVEPSNESKSMADFTELRALKAARIGNSGPRHSTREHGEFEDMELRGSYIEKKFRTGSAAGAEWHRGQLLHPIRGGSMWMVSSLHPPYSNIFIIYFKYK
jgi:hypothetical protein